MSRIVWAFLTWLGLAGFYLFLAGTADAVELGAAAVCASAGTAMAVGFSFVTEQQITLRPAPRALWRPLAALLPELFAVGRELVAVVSRGASRHRGDYVHQPFDFGTDAPREAGRRALALIGVSLAPRAFVVRGEDADGTVLLHGLPAKAVSPDARWPA